MDFLIHFNSLSFFSMEFRMEYKKSVSVTAWVELSQCYCFVIWNVYTKRMGFMYTMIQLVKKYL